MPSFQPGYCSGSSFGVPDFGALHPIIEQIKEDTRLRRQQGALRNVDLVRKFAKNKGKKRSSFYRMTKKATGHELRPLLHWALRIDGKYFELYRLPGTSKADFVIGDWNTSRFDQVTEETPNYGTTYMTDEQIQTIGRHYIHCWGLDYAALTNNCQKLLIAVCQDCLEEPDSELGKLWLGYKLAAIPVALMRPFSHGALKLLHCPKQLRSQWDDAMIDLYLTEYALLTNTRSELYHRLKANMEGTSTPWRALASSWSQHVVYQTHVLSAPYSLYPYPKKVPSMREPIGITNMRTESQKWTNRTFMLSVPIGVIYGSANFLRDLTRVILFEPRSIKAAFERRSKAKLEAQLQRIENYDPVLGTSIEDDSRPFPDAMESMYQSTAEAVKRFYNGSGNWEEILLCWKRIMDTEGLTWDDVAQEVKERKVQAQAAFDGAVEKTLNPKEKKISRLLDFTNWAMFTYVLIAAIEIGDVVWTHMRPAVDLAT